MLRTAEVPCSTHRPTFSVAPQRCTYPQAIQKYYYILMIARPFSYPEQFCSQGGQSLDI